MNAPKPTEDIRKEPLIRKKWNFTLSAPSARADGIFITGANSFVGTHATSLLQNQWPGSIHLLLRAGSKDKARQKMEKAFNTWQAGLFDPQRFTIHLGDVSLNLMGLSSAEYLSLQKETGYVLHLAMNPLYHLPYAHFKRLWLPELARMIAFCGTKHKIKSLHYPTSYNANFFTQDDDYYQLNANAWQSGYAGFKWVSNQVLKNAFAQNLGGCLYDIPLVLGSLEKGLCPAHYSIWHILDMFLKTGYYIPFAFKIIPVDVLAEIIVSNLLADKQGKGMIFIRPVLDEAVTDVQFNNTVANILGLRKTDMPTMRAACPNKRRFDFMFPPNFYELLDKVNSLPAVLPEKFSPQYLPATTMVFLSNLNRILATKEAEV